MQFIDIHGHYAWDIDDGMPSKEDAKKALQLAVDNHISTIVATPHIVPGSHTQKDINDIKERINDLKMLAQDFHIHVYEGCELFFNHDCVNSIHNKLFIPFENTSYVLIEFDVRKELGDEFEVEDYLYELEVAGYKPIIAHAERYFKKNIDTDRIQRFIDNGYIIQINSSSLLGVHGHTVQKNAYRLIDEGLAHVIASDTHRSEGRRIPNLLSCFHLLSKKYDYQIIKTLMYDNPYHILHNESIEHISIKKSFFKKLWNRGN